MDKLSWRKAYLDESRQECNIQRIQEIRKVTDRRFQAMDGGIVCQAQSWRIQDLEWHNQQHKGIWKWVGWVQNTFSEKWEEHRWNASIDR